jgi:hypothetical protein
MPTSPITRVDVPNASKPPEKYPTLEKPIDRMQLQEEMAKASNSYKRVPNDPMEQELSMICVVVSTDVL